MKSGPNTKRFMDPRPYTGTGGPRRAPRMRTPRMSVGTPSLPQHERATLLKFMADQRLRIATRLAKQTRKKVVQALQNVGDETTVERKS